MSAAGTYHVYILASGRHGTLYIGVTNNLPTRLESIAMAAARSSHRLVHVQTLASPSEAIAREKQLKNWHRDWMIRLIEENNLDWSDLSHLL